LHGFRLGQRQHLGIEPAGIPAATIDVADFAILDGCLDNLY